MRNSTKFILIAITALLLASCGNIAQTKSIHGSGNITIENRTVAADFKSIEVSNAIELVVEQSEQKGITVETDDNIQSSILTRVENGVLIVESRPNSYRNVRIRKVTVKMPVIEKLESSSGSSIRCVATLKGNKIHIEASSGSSIKLNLEYESINSTSSSGSTIKIKGNTTELRTDASSGSNLNASEMMAKKVISSASSGASTEVYPIESLKADASSGGSIAYVNVPTTIEKDTSSGASITKR